MSQVSSSEGVQASNSTKVLGCQNFEELTCSFGGDVCPFLKTFRIPRAPTPKAKPSNKRTQRLRPCHCSRAFSPRRAVRVVPLFTTALIINLNRIHANHF